MWATIHNEPIGEEVLFSRRNRMQMAFWAVILLALWGSLFFAGVRPALQKLNHTPNDSSGYQVVTYDASGRVVRPATESDMWKEKYKGVISVAFFGVVSGAVGFLLLTALVDYRSRFLGWSIKQLPRLFDTR